MKEVLLAFGLVLSACTTGSADPTTTLTEVPTTAAEIDALESFFRDAEGSDAITPIMLTGYKRRFSPIARRLRDHVRERLHPLVMTYRMNAGYLPDDLTLPLVWLGLIVNLGGAFVPLRDAVIGAVAAYLFLWSINAAFRALRGMDGMGYGDFKLYAAVGAFLGWKVLPLVILLSSLVGLVFGTLQMFAARRGWDWKFKFHFGPYLALAGIIAMFWGHALMQRFPALRFAG